MRPSSGGLGSIFGRFGGCRGVLGRVLGTLGRLLGHLGGVFGDVGRPWGHHGSHEAVLDALRRTSPGARAACLAKKDPRWHPKWDPKRTKIEHENEDEKRCS